MRRNGKDILFGRCADGRTFLFFHLTHIQHQPFNSSELPGLPKTPARQKHKKSLSDRWDEFLSCIEKGGFHIDEVMRLVVENKSIGEGIVDLTPTRGGHQRVYMMVPTHKGDSAKTHSRLKRIVSSQMREIDERSPAAGKMIERVKKRQATCSLSKEEIHSHTTALNLSQNKSIEYIYQLRESGIETPSIKVVHTSRDNALPHTIESGTLRVPITKTKRKLENPTENKLKEANNKALKKAGKQLKKEINPHKESCFSLVPWARVTPEALPRLLRSFVRLLVKKEMLVKYPNLPKNTLMLLMGIDKGKSDTKLVVTVTNCFRPTSSRATLVLACYQGDEEAESHRLVFEPLVNKLSEMTNADSWLTYEMTEGEDDVGDKEYELCFDHLLDRMNVEKQWLFRSGCNEEKCTSCRVPDTADMNYFSKLQIINGGDMKALNAIYGISTPTCTYACAKCLWDRTRDKNKTDTVPRTMALLYEKFNSFVTEYDAARVYSGGNQLHSVVAKPLLPNSPVWDPSKAMSAMPLHVSIGIAQKLLDFVEFICAKLDAQLLGSTDVVKRPSRKANANEEAETVEVEDGWSIESDSEEEGGYPSLDDVKPIYAELKNLYLQRDLLSCREYPQDDEEDDEKEGRNDDVDDNSTPYREELAALNEKIAEMTEKAEKMTAEMERARRPFSTLLDGEWKDCHVQRAVYYSGAINGNDAKKIFDPETQLYMGFLDVLDNRPDPTSKGKPISKKQSKTLKRIKETLVKVFSSFAVLRKLMNTARPLCVAELKEFEDNLAVFQESYVELGNTEKNDFFDPKKYTITPKIHHLLAHALPFLQLYGSIGMFSEESIERVHVEWNYISDLVSHQRGEERLRSCMVIYFRRLVAADLPKPPRICPKCDLPNSRTRFTDHCVCNKQQKSDEVEEEANLQRCLAKELHFEALPDDW